MRAAHLLLLTSLVACKSDDETDAVLDTDEAGDTDDTDDTDVEAACTVLDSGTYGAKGACFGMAMTVVLTMDAEACTFTLDDWSMNHGNSPETGTVVGDEVTLAGGDFDGCTGTIDGDTISGTCDDGCAWELSL